MEQTAPANKNAFFLKPSIRLIPETGGAGQGGVVLQPSPLRALKLNRAAFEILEKCRHGYFFTHKSETRAYGVSGTNSDCLLKNSENSASDKGVAEKEAETPDRNPGMSREYFEKKVLPFLDALCQAEILEWRPPETTFEPMVSIVIPVFNRAHEIGACLESLKKLDYPESRMEIIVVDDASSDQSAAVAKNYGAKVIVQGTNLGPAAARNRAVREASGEIIAFIDSDCTAEPQWLRRLIRYFKDTRYVLVGGHVDSCLHDSSLDRYEAVKSALNMGDKKVIGAGKNSVFYVPTCNVLIRRDVYLSVGGLNERMRVGEDVDLCWRLMKTGYQLIYVPEGPVKHKHRNDFFTCFKRRYDYGTSEAVLYGGYPETTKRFPWQSGGMAFLILCLCGLVSKSPFFPAAALLLLFSEAAWKKKQLAKKFNAALAFKTILWAVFRSHFLFIYYLTYHFTRYYLVPLGMAAFFLPALAPTILFTVLFPGIVEFFRKKPRLNPAMFIFYFWMEQAFYQTGVLAGCILRKSFRLYRISFVYAGFIKGENPFRKLLKKTMSGGK